jgi:peptidoglycan/LPS O-acetylase OafA/YrhL
LDALRGIAIFAVFMTHLSGYWFRATRLPLELPILNVNLLDIFRYGYLGVSLFFLLSGYLLTWTEEKRASRGNYSLLSYAKRRAFRLIPAYYAAILIIVVFRPGTPSFSSLALHLTFLQGFSPAYPRGLDGVFWSLTPEVLFYALLPFFVIWLRSFPVRLAALGVLAALSLGTRLYMSSRAGLDLIPLGGEFSGTRLYFYPTTLLYLFIVGMLLRKAVEWINERGTFERWKPVALVCSVAPLGLLVFPLFMRQGQFLASPLAMVAELLIISLFVAVLLGSPLLKPIMRWRPLAFFGKISYSVFVLHTTVIFLLFRYVLWELRPQLTGLEGPVVWAAFSVYGLAAIAITTTVSYLSFRFIESPFLRRKPK